MSEAVLADDEKLWPTDLYTGECVSATIYAPRSPAQQKIDNEYCNQGLNQGNPEKISICLKNARGKSSSFFTDRCGSEEGRFFISLNGVEYKLRLIEKARSSPVDFAGRYEGQGLEVQVKSGRLLRRTYLPDSPPGKKELASVEFRVLVVVKKGSRTERIPGVFLERR